MSGVTMQLSGPPLFSSYTTPPSPPPPATIPTVDFLYAYLLKLTCSLSLEIVSEQAGSRVSHEPFSFLFFSPPPLSSRP